MLYIFFSDIMYFMTVEQIVEIPANRRIALEVPRTVPIGKTILSFTPVSVSQTADVSPRTTAEARQIAKAKSADPNRKPFSRHFGKLSPDTYGDGVAYQRAIRYEWDD